MKSPFLLLTLACALGQSDGREWVLSPQLAPGLEFVYSGVCTEESLLPGVQYRRVYRLDNHLFVLGGEKEFDVAFMTSLGAREPGEVPRYTVASVKLELARLDGQGRLKAVVPGVTLRPPMDRLPLIEAGCFVEAPQVRVGVNSFWEVAEENRPTRSWQIVGTESMGGLMCVKVVGQQKSDDWDQPRADRVAWRRRDVVWLSTQIGVAVKVQRTIERRDPARREPSHCTTAEYMLESRLRYPGRLFEDRKREILQAKKFADEAGPFLKQAAQQPAHFETLVRKMEFHLENSPPTPYRKAVAHLSQRIDSARKGELLLADHTSPAEAPSPIGPLSIGQKVPDFVLNDLTHRGAQRFSRLLGRPIVAIYFNPHTSTGTQVMEFAKELTQQMGDHVTIMAMAVTKDHAAAARRKAELKLPFAVYDGNAMRITLGVDATPRILILDAEGTIRAATTGWGPHIPGELHDQVRSLLNSKSVAPR